MEEQANSRAFMAGFAAGRKYAKRTKRAMKKKAKSLPSFDSGQWECYMDDGYEKYYCYSDAGIDYELVETEDGWNGNVDGDPLIMNVWDDLYRSADDAIKAMERF